MGLLIKKRHKFTDMTHSKPGILILLSTLFLFFSCTPKSPKTTIRASDELMIRIAEIEIEPAALDQYIAILKKESEASIRIEPGVISIYPMFEKDQPTKIRILEIYENDEAYQAHLQTPHFKEYKSTTLNMVKSLKLIEMKGIYMESMPLIFKKLND